MTTEQTELGQAEAEQAPEKQSEFFQAIGIITGDVAFIKDEERNIYVANVTIAEHQYNLLAIRNKKDSFNGLRKQIEATGITKYRLIVYPKITHYPGREQPHRTAFQLVAFEKEAKENQPSSELDDFEFKLSGLWQFIPVCKTPCITVMKNFSAERLDYIKQAETALKVSFMKASHIPLMWRDAVVSAFRYNPKTPKEEQGKAMFVSIKARFIPGVDMFGFDSLLALPQDEIPKHLRAAKRDKVEVLKSKLAERKERQKTVSPAKKVIAPVSAPVKKADKKVVEKSQSQTGIDAAAVAEKPKLKPKN